MYVCEGRGGDGERREGVRMQCLAYLWWELEDGRGLELVVEDRLDEVLARALTGVTHALVRADGVVRVHAPSALVVQPRAQVEGGVRKKTLVVPERGGEGQFPDSRRERRLLYSIVWPLLSLGFWSRDRGREKEWKRHLQRVAQHLGHGWAAHWLLVEVLVVDRSEVEHLVQLRPVAVEARARDHALAVHLEDHRLVRSQNTETCRQPAREKKKARVKRSKAEEGEDQARARGKAVAVAE